VNKHFGVCGEEYIHNCVSDFIFFAWFLGDKGQLLAVWVATHTTWQSLRMKDQSFHEDITPSLAEVSTHHETGLRLLPAK